MASLTNVLAGIPGYAGYIAAREAGQEREMGDLRQASTLAQIQASLEARQKAAVDQQREVALRTAIAALPPEKRTRENVLPLLLEHGNITTAANLLPAAPKPAGMQSVGAGGLYDPETKTVIPPAARPDNKEVKPPAIRQRYDGTNVVQEEYIDGAWRVIGKGPRFQPDKPTQPSNPKPDFQWNADGTEQEVIPGSATDRKLKTDKAQGKMRTGSMVQSIERLSSAMQELYDDPGLPRITGPVFGRTPNATAEATGAQAKLNNVTSNIFQSALQAMREASKTGGAVGNVSDREGDKLERTLAALDQAQGTKDFQAQLKKAMDQLRISKELITNAYKEQFGEDFKMPTPGPAEGQTATNPKTGEKVIYRGGQWRPTK